MSDGFRLLETGFAPAAFNMGLDEAILESVSSREKPPTLRFYGWNPRAISIGYFQGAREEVDVEACRSLGVDLVRRITGGGAVFHDREVTYSIIIPEGHRLAPPSIADSYSILCSGIIAGLALLGIEASFAPINDIAAGGRKISGNAQTRKKGCLLQHGTIILKADVDTMFSLLRIPAEKSRGKLILDAKARIASVWSLTGSADFNIASEALKKGFAQALSISLVPDSLSPVETERAAALAREKFSRDEWTFRR